MHEGGCHCGAVRYRIEGQIDRAALCHCRDCQRHAGAPVVGWAAIPAERFAVVQGQAKAYRSSELAERFFCPDCGTGLYYINETVLPGLVDVQMASLDNAAATAPQAQIQVAERLPWMEGLDALPAFERYPEG